MTKTENYQLPQWEPHDPVRRTDFNAANQAIDAALQAIGTAAVSANNRERTLACSRLMGYDLYQNTARSICALGKALPMKNAAFNGLTRTDEQSRVEGLRLSEGSGSLGPSTLPTLDDINSGITSWQDGTTGSSYPYVCTASVTFSSGWFRGTITALDVWYSRTTATSTAQLTLYVRLYDVKKGTYVWQSDAITSAVLKTTDVAETLAVNLTLEAQRTYRLELYYTGVAVFSGTIGFGVKGTQALTGTATGIAYTEGTVRENITPGSPAGCVTALVHYTGGSTPSAEINGEEIPLLATRSGVSAVGESCTEAEFCLFGEWADTAELTARFQSTTNQQIHDVLFYMI